MSSVQKIQTTIKDFQFLNKLGEGSFSQVYRVKRLSDNQEYALKKVKMNMLSKKEKENALNEVRILASIDSPYIIQYKEAFFDEDSNCLCVIMEYADNGDLLKKIKTNASINGLHTLHQMKILHRDLKCANVFVSKNNVAKLGDLNVSKIAKKGLVQTQTGTPYYASPEVWKDKPYGAKSDIWSLGCIVYEMATLKPPFRANDLQGLFRRVQTGKYDPLPSVYSNDLSMIVAQCLKVDPAIRSSCEELLNNPLIKIHNQDVCYQVVEFAQKPTKDQLLQTIVLPKNLRQINFALPKSKYQNEKKRSYEENLDEINVLKKNQLDDINNILPTKPQRITSAQVKLNNKPSTAISSNDQNVKLTPKQQKIQDNNSDKKKRPYQNHQQNLNEIKENLQEKYEEIFKVEKNLNKNLEDQNNQKLNNHKNNLPLENIQNQLKNQIQMKPPSYPSIANINNNNNAQNYQQVKINKSHITPVKVQPPTIISHNQNNNKSQQQQVKMPPIQRSNSNIEMMINNSNRKEKRENIMNHYHKRSNSQLGGGGSKITNQYDILYQEYQQLLSKNNNQNSQSRQQSADKNKLQNNQNIGAEKGVSVLQDNSIANLISQQQQQQNKNNQKIIQRQQSANIYQSNNDYLRINNNNKYYYQQMYLNNNYNNINNKENRYMRINNSVNQSINNENKNNVNYSYNLQNIDRISNNNNYAYNARIGAAKNIISNNYKLNNDNNIIQNQKQIQQQHSRPFWLY